MKKVIKQIKPLPKKSFKDIPEECKIIDDKGNLWMILNAEWVRQKGLNDKQLARLRKVHLKRVEIFKEMQKETDVVKLQKYVERVKRLEFQLQAAWGFNRNVDFHSWWYRCPHCSCPTIDNDERVGTSFSVINDSCILHGSSKYASKEEFLNDI